jgi:hypothetical protein
LYLITSNFLNGENIKEKELQFWIKFIKVYVLEKTVNEVMGCLVYGVFDRRVREIMVKGEKM